MEDMSEARPLRDEIVKMLRAKADEYEALVIPDVWTEEYQTGLNRLRWEFVQGLQAKMIDLELPPMNIVKPRFVEATGGPLVDTEHPEIAAILKRRKVEDGFPANAMGFRDYRHYQGMTLDELKKIVDLWPDEAQEQQNDAPSIEEFIALGEEFPGMTYHGYSIHPPREDTRVSVEGFDFRGTREQVVALSNKLHSEFSVEEAQVSEDGLELHTWCD